MAWVKRAGGAGGGIYSNGIPTVGTAVGPKAVQRLTPQNAGEPVPPKDDGPAPAYRVTERRQVVDNRVILDVLAGWVREGGEPEMSMLYEDALEAFGEDSVHFIAACKGQAGVGVHYQRSVAGGRFRDGG